MDRTSTVTTIKSNNEIKYTQPYQVFLTIGKERYVSN